MGQKGVLEEQKGTNREKCNWERPGTNGLERRLGVGEAILQVEKAKPLSHRPSLGAPGDRCLLQASLKTE